MRVEHCFQTSNWYILSFLHDNCSDPIFVDYHEQFRDTDVFRCQALVIRLSAYNETRGSTKQNRRKIQGSD